MQYLMGHADIQNTLNIYAHYRMEDARNDLERARILEEINMEMDKTRADEALEGLKRVRSL